MRLREICGSLLIALAVNIVKYLFEDEDQSSLYQA